MKQLHLFLTALVLLIFVSNVAMAQFDESKSTVGVSTKIDTIRVNTSKTSEMLDFKIYNDAYDRYLRELQKKFRNSFQYKSGMALTQTSFSNWAAGGTSSFSGRAYLNTEHKYTAPTFNIQSNFDAAIGMLSSDGLTKKSEDYFTLTSKPSWKISEHWQLSASFILRSQFSNTYIIKKNTAGEEYSLMSSTIFAPAYLTAAPGVKYINTAKTIETFFSPSAGNMIMVLNTALADQGSFGKPGRKFNSQFINYFSFIYKEKILNNKLSFDVKFESFWNYNHGTPRLISENKIGYQLTRVLSANFYMMAIYDDTIKTPEASNHLQLTETIGLGVGYTFASKKHPAPPEKPRKDYKRKAK